MKKLILISALASIAFICHSQSRQLVALNTHTGKSSRIKNGDHILYNIRVSRYDAIKKPSSAYLLSKLELEDSVCSFARGKVLKITDSSIIVKEKRAFFGSDKRELRIAKINAIRRLSFGNQALRTGLNIGDGFTKALTCFYGSFLISGTGYGFGKGMLYAAGANSIFSSFNQSRLAKKQLDNWQLQIAPNP